MGLVLRPPTFRSSICYCKNTVFHTRQQIKLKLVVQDLKDPCHKLHCISNKCKTNRRLEVSREHVNVDCLDYANNVRCQTRPRSDTFGTENLVVGICKNSGFSYSVSQQVLDSEPEVGSKGKVLLFSF